MAKYDPHWIEHAHIKKGAFDAYAKHEHESVTKAYEKASGEKSKASPKVKKEAVLARTFAHLRKI